MRELFILQKLCIIMTDRNNNVTDSIKPNKSIRKRITEIIRSHTNSPRPSRRPSIFYVSAPTQGNGNTENTLLQQQLSRVRSRVSTTARDISYRRGQSGLRNVSVNNVMASGSSSYRNRQNIDHERERNYKTWSSFNLDVTDKDNDVGDIGRKIGHSKHLADTMDHQKSLAHPFGKIPHQEEIARTERVDCRQESIAKQKQAIEMVDEKKKVKQQNKTNCTKSYEENIISQKKDHIGCQNWEAELVGDNIDLRTGRSIKNEIKEIISRVIERVVGCNKYQDTLVQKWSRDICTSVRNHVRTLTGMEHAKVVVTTLIGSVVLSTDNADSASCNILSNISNDDLFVLVVLENSDIFLSVWVLAIN